MPYGTVQISDLYIAYMNVPRQMTRITFYTVSRSSHSSTYSLKGGWKCNRFLRTIHDLIDNTGDDPAQIVPFFKPYSSSDFIFGAPVPTNPNIPQRIWTAVCAQYNMFLQRPYTRYLQIEQPMTFKQRSDVFITNKVTVQLVQNKYIREHFPSAQRLYQYLNWTMRMNKMARTDMMMEGQDGRRVLLIDIELHDQRGQELYALCTPNDMVTPESQQWQLAHLLTANAITNLLGVDYRALPRGARAVSSQFENHRELMRDPMGLKQLKKQISKLDSRRKPIRYAHLKCVQTGKRRRKQKDLAKVMRVTLTTFHNAIRQALVDEAVDLVPIVSITSRLIKGKKEKFEDFRFEFVFSVLYH